MDQTLRILHLEDDPDDATLIHRRLEAEGLSVAVRHVQDLEAFRSALTTGDFDLVLSDFRLGAATGLDALEVRKQLRPDVPFIFVSGALGEERAVETLRNGATDYVLKDRQARLGSAVRRALREVSERKQRHRAEAERDRFYALSLDLFCTLDAEGRILDPNPSWERVLGWSPAELGSLPLLERVHPEDRPAVETMLAQLAEGQAVASVESRLEPGTEAGSGSSGAPSPSPRRASPTPPPGTSACARAPRRPFGEARSSSASPRRWTPSGSWRGGWPTTSTTCSPPSSGTPSS
jgi:PAS domain S-box-containing protein